MSISPNQASFQNAIKKVEIQHPLPNPPPTAVLNRLNTVLLSSGTAIPKLQAALQESLQKSGYLAHLESFITAELEKLLDEEQRNGFAPRANAQIEHEVLLRVVDQLRRDEHSGLFANHAATEEPIKVLKTELGQLCDINLGEL